MATVKSNSPEISRTMSGLADALNMQGRGSGRPLGEEIADTAAVAISVRTRDKQVGPDGSGLPKLNARYKRRKIAKGLDPRILVAGGEMTEPDSIKGDVTVTASTTVMVCGSNERMRDLIAYAEAGDSERNRPPRHFIDLGKDGEAAVNEVFSEAVDRAMRKANG